MNKMQIAWRERPVEDRLKTIGRIVFPTEGVLKIDTVMKRALASHGTRREGQVAVVYGETRTGKTTGVELFMMKHAESSGGVFESINSDDQNIAEIAGASFVTIRRDGRVEHPIVRIQVSPTPTFNGLLGDTIFVLTGRRAPRSANFTERMRLVTNQLYGQRIKLLVFDDAHHVAQTRAVFGKYLAADVFKVLAKVTGAELVLVGLSEVLDLNLNPQLDWMFQQVVEIQPFEWPVNESSKFVRFLEKVQKHFPFDTPSRIADLETAQRLYAYSGGHIGRLSLLLQSAVQYAIEEDIEFIDGNTLGLTLRNMKGLKGEKNAFLSKAEPEPPHRRRNDHDDGYDA